MLVPGHISSLQFSFSCSSWCFVAVMSRSVPPCLAGVYVLFLSLVPVLQGLLQFDHVLQSSHLPSTKQKSYYSNTIQSYSLLYLLQKVNSWPAYQVSGYQPSKTKKVCGHKRVTVNTDRLHQGVKSRTPNGASTLLNLCSNYKVIQFWEGI